MITDREEYLKVREFIKNKSLNLMNHEQKNNAKTGIAIGNYERFSSNGKHYYLIPTNIYKAIIEKNLLIARINHPELFGTGHAMDVLKAIQIVEPWYDLERFADVLRSEQFCYIVEVDNGKINEKILRLDLYRHLKANEDGKSDFVGGIFHAFKHFSCENRYLSTSKEINNIDNPKELTHLILEAFFSSSLIRIDENTYKVELKINNKNFRFIFYHEIKTGVYFLKTVYRI
ncbi:hypothetical protein [Chryseobacterium sp. T20]|uniref:hypothetical protein n=1 Tax=Chryseobacterium sp. T20 TaxID=3395375 RepID=UPI0039BC7A92